ncbi:hypothetical protein BH11PAT2_BH11PAT2_02020 [soil metagenome]
MLKTLEIEVRVAPKKLSRASLTALENVGRFDWILFTSKHAVTFFTKELRLRNVKLARTTRIAAVGPETAAALRAAGLTVQLIPERFTVRDMVFALGRVKGLRILFPRSAVAPQEPIQILRAQGARVRVVPLYIPIPIALSQATKHALVTSSYTTLSFKSPSGIQGFMRQLNTAEKKIVREIPVVCIGPTTARAARKAGFRHVSYAVL